ncbi:helix-turn-helix transcriptional regulator [Klebsiella quasivariicola]|uniref:helix-turn-helix transcriptional regulator n=1 Tax=Klebsiella quasivariicola TaxID=2026240 RepID=UPI0031DDD749
MVQNKTDKHPKLIRLTEVKRRTGFGKTWIYTLIRAGKFPKQVKIGDRAVAFIESEVDEWIYKAITASRNTSN